MSAGITVTTSAALEHACDSMTAGTELHVDTEFVRERTYFARLCLIQIRSGDSTWLVDPLAIDSLDALWQVFDSMPLVFHAARQDLEILQQTAGRLPATVLDTQVMAALAGYAPQIGYAGLVKTLLDIDVDKSKTRTDWSRRPLDDEELAYAAADVAYLGELRHRLADELDGHGRLAWAEEDSRALLAPDLYDNDLDAAWQRVKGIGRLQPKQRSVAMLLARWREQKAIERNLPRQWILRDSEILAIAATYGFDGRPPAGFEDKATERRHARAIDQFLMDNKDALPPPPPTRERPDAAERDLARYLGSVVAGIAGELGMEAEVLASMREVRAAAAGERDLKMLSGWRRGVVGEAVLKELDSAA